jgi:hypothetical protein
MIFSDLASPAEARNEDSAAGKASRRWETGIHFPGFNAINPSVDYSAGCGKRALSTPLARIAIITAATRKPIATTAVALSTRPKPPRA